MATHHRIAILGAGPGGICMAIKLREAGIEDFIILERGSEAGGTWTNNRYPGLACDVPSLLYCFSFEQKVDWTRSYANQPEIKAYMQHCVDKYDVARHIRFNTNVDSAHWDDRAAQWRIATAGGETVTADIFVSALGMFNEIQWPAIPGLERFKGEMIHTALWPATTNLAGKRVGVVGSAASAVQMIPEIAEQAGYLTVFQRTANWVMPKQDKTFTEAELAAYRKQPEDAIKVRRETYDFFEELLLFDKPEMMAELERAALENLALVEDEATRAKMRPTVPLGSQRPLFSNEYYPTFNRPNVALVTESIECFTADGIATRDGVTHPLDTIILATGYAANKFLSVIDVAGRDGRKLADAWADGPQAYLGITTAGFPNLFMLYGPNTNNGSILEMLEHQVAYVIDKIATLEQRKLAWIDVKQPVMDAYNEAIQRDIQAVAVWRVLGSKYYRAGSGRVVTQWPHNMATYKAWTGRPDLDAFETAARA
jgi:cation diffusion facilitator CzcD-associated flavoprotein CzcO